jgi:hypothetical protein
MIESSARPGEAAAGQWLHPLFGWWCRLTFVLEGQDQDALEAAHIDHVEAQRSGTRGVQALGRVALG